MYWTENDLAFHCTLDQINVRTFASAQYYLSHCTIWILIFWHKYTLRAIFLCVRWISNITYFEWFFFRSLSETCTIANELLVQVFFGLWFNLLATRNIHFQRNIWSAGIFNQQYEFGFKIQTTWYAKPTSERFFLIRMATLLWHDIWNVSISL